MSVELLEKTQYAVRTGINTFLLDTIIIIIK